MNKPISIALLVVGILLLVWGLGASDSFTSHVSETVNGAPANKTIWLIGSGVVLTVAGFFGLFSFSRQK